jgi:hypothetical protein
VITRFNLDHFSEGVSDTSALRLLLDEGARIRGLKRLHAKLYLFGSSEAIVTSANLTKAGLERNHELGLVARGGDAFDQCDAYFRRLWSGAGEDLTVSKLEGWEARIADHHAKGGPTSAPGLGDEGAEITDEEDVVLPPWSEEPTQAFVKFFGEGHRRAPRSTGILDEVRGSGCHWACTYPVGKRPRAPRDGAIMFMGRMVHSPNDTLIYGRAVGMRHVEGRDDATPAEIERRPWKADWPYYIRVHHPEFITGTLENGISLAQLMDTLGAQAFGPTAEHAAEGSGNTNPRRAIRQAAAVRLAPEGWRWLNECFERALNSAGTISSAQLAALDWPGADLGGLVKAATNPQHPVESTR